VARPIPTSSRTGADGPAFQGFPAEALTFFDDLAAHNSKAWFHAHKDVYEDCVRGPMRALVDGLEDEFGPLVLSRPNRDVRFAHGRDPYKLEIYARSRGSEPGGWYVRLGPDGLFAGGGMYMPDREHLARLRAAVADDRTGPQLAEIVAALEAAGVEIVRHGSLKTAPRGYPADHPRIGLLRLANVAGGRSWPPRRWLHTPAARNRVVDTWHELEPLADWLATNV
jgi:uncharacterized protein (TIGR02453 family)